MAFKEITAATSEPITLPQAKKHLKIESDVTIEDDLINILIESARRAAETYMRRQIITATWELQLDKFPKGSDFITLNLNKATSITTIKYFDDDNSEQTWDSAKYETDLESEPARIRPISTEIYPSTFDKINNVKIRFVTGYANAAAVPGPIIQALLLYIGHWYEHRESVVIGQRLEIQELPQGSRFLLDDYRVFEFK